MRAAALLTTVALLAGCGGHKAQTPDQVARAWSADLNRSDDLSAANLFASDAQVVQSGAITLHGHKDAYQWNHALPCGGTITHITEQGKDQVLVVFLLKERPGHSCDGPGQAAAAIFRVAHGKITLWHQVPPPAQAPVI